MKGSTHVGYHSPKKGCKNRQFPENNVMLVGGPRGHVEGSYDSGLYCNSFGHHIYLTIIDKIYGRINFDSPSLLDTEIVIKTHVTIDGNIAETTDFELTTHGYLDLTR